MSGCTCVLLLVQQPQGGGGPWGGCCHSCARLCPCRTHPLGMLMSCFRRGTCADLLPKLLGGPVRLFTTKCVMHELRGLGKEYAGGPQPVRGCSALGCGHPACSYCCLLQWCQRSQRLWD